VLGLPPTPQLLLDTSSNGLINAFYMFFFPAHPFVLPRVQMLEMFGKSRFPELQLAIKYIGSFYVFGSPQEICEQALNQALAAYSGPKDAMFVQAMVLYAIGLHMAAREPESAPVMYSAIRTALELGMNLRSYSMTNGGIGTIMEECLRRTWWEIFVLDGMFSGVNLDYSIQLTNVTSDIPLPVEESDYVNGVSAVSGVRVGRCITLLAYDIGAEDTAGI
jgi:hypothetical protein